MAKVGRRGRLAGCLGTACGAPVIPAMLQGSTVGQRGRVGSRAASCVCCRRGAGRPSAGLERASGFPLVFSLDVQLGVRATAGESICYSDKLNACAQWLQSYPTLCDPMDCTPPGSSVHGILQARILDWVAMPSPRGSS